MIMLERRNRPSGDGHSCGRVARVEFLGVFLLETNGVFRMCPKDAGAYDGENCSKTFGRYLVVLRCFRGRSC